MSNTNYRKKSLVAVQGTAQFIAAYISLLWFERSVSKRELNPVLLVYDTSIPEENESLISDTITRLSSLREWADVLFIGQKEMREISLNRKDVSKRKLISKLQDHEFENIFIARGFGSFGTQLVLDTYKNAVRIEYGDSFGFVGNENALKVTFYDFVKSPKNIAKLTLKKILYGHFFPRFSFDFSILTLPLDWSGDYLNDKNLVVPPKEFAVELLIGLSKQLPDLESYCNQLISGIAGECNLYMLSNFSNSRLSSQENEIELYEKIIRETAKIGTTIILKNHPRGSDSTLVRLKERLIETFEIRVIDRKEFILYPIELWVPLINKARVFPIFSSSIISLKYFFSKNVILSLDAEKIQTYIQRNKVQQITGGEIMYREAAINLDHWDGNSPLWKRNKL